MMLTRTVLTVSCVVVLLVAPTQAGIIVLDNGETIVGKFGDEDVTDEVISVRTLEGEGRSAMKVPRHRVRWYDTVAFAPTDRYFLSHLEDSLAARWEPLREEHRLRLAAEQAPGVDELVADPRELVVGEPLTRLDLGHLSVGSPRGWFNNTDGDEITMCVGAKRKESEYAPRIHVFSVEAPRATTPHDQLALVQRELQKLAAEGGYRTEELHHLKKQPGGADQVMITVTRGEDGREVRALRKICFRAERTYFFAAYADARDFEDEEGRFWASLESFLPKEDERKP